MEATSGTETPLGNTGLNLQNSIGLDWLNFTGTCATVEEVQDLVSAVCTAYDDAPIWTHDKAISKGKYYQHSASSVHGAKFGYTPNQSNGFDYWVSLPAKVLRRLELLESIYFLAEFRKHLGFKATRCDVALDDYTKQHLTYENLSRSIAAGNYTGFKAHSSITNHDGGWTFYLGSRQSDKMVRVYNKSVQSAGETDAYRIEIELKDYKAEYFFDTLCGAAEHSPEFVPQVMLETICGAVDFRDRDSDSNITRCERLQWWSNFLSYCLSTGGLRLPAKKRVSSLDRTVQWIQAQVETSIAMVRDALGEKRFNAFLNRCIADGRNRYRNEQRAILRLHEQKHDVCFA
jgi:Replication initiation factor